MCLQALLTPLSLGGLRGFLAPGAHRPNTRSLETLGRAWWAQWAQLGSEVAEPLGPLGSCQRLESRQLFLSLFWSVGGQGLRPASQSLKDSASASAIDLHLERDEVHAQGPH